MKIGTKVLIKFSDSNVIHGWMPDDCSQDDVAHCQIVGILQAEDDTKVIVVLGDSNYNSVLEKIIIPKGCIESIRELRIK